MTKGIIRNIFLLANICSLLLLAFPLAAYSADTRLLPSVSGTSREKDQNVHRRLKESAKRLTAALDTGENVQGHMDNVMKDISALEGQDAEVQKRFSEIEERLKSSGSPKAWKRHYEARAKYKGKAAEVKGHIAAIREAKKRKAHPTEIGNMAKNLVDAIYEGREDEDYQLKDSSNLPWKVVEPGEIMLLGDTPSTPGQGSQAAQTPPTATDLSPTLDIQITPEIQALADSLNNDPLKIFRYVYNNYNYTPYYGSMKGSLDTYWEKEGNDYDLASLLISLLRASNVPARYAKTKILVPVDKLTKWLAIDDPMAAMQYLSMAQVPLGYYVQGGKIAYVQVEHVYVEAFIPYGNYRGTGEDDTGKIWVPLDPSFKEYKVVQAGMEMTTQMGLTWKAFSDEYLGDLMDITPLDYYKNKIEQYVAQNYPGQTVGSLKRVEQMKTMLFDFLPGTLPYEMVNVPERFSEIPQGLRHTMRFTIPGVLDYTGSLPEVSGRRITLSFEGAEADDQALISQYGNIFKTPPYLIEIKPVLRINGVTAAVGTAMSAGIGASFSVTYTQPGAKTDTFDHSIITGSFNAVGITIGQVRPEFLTIAEVEASEEPYMSKMLHSLVMKYQNQQNVTKQTLNETMKIKSRTFMSEALVSSREDISKPSGIPMSFELSGFMIDAKEMASGIMPVNGYDKTKVIDFAMIYGHEASFQENRTFEDSMFWVSGLSAVKGLQLLKAMGIGVTELTPPMTYSNPNLPDVVITDVNNALNRGWKVIVPEDTGGLPAVPYIKYDASTGSAGYMIAGRAGGFNWNITPTGYEADLTFVKDMFMSNNITMKYELLFPDSPHLVAMGDNFMLGLRVIAEGPYGVRSVHDAMITIDTDWTHYFAGKWPLYSFLMGSYKIKFDGRDLFEFITWGPIIDTEASGKSLEISTKDGTKTVLKPVTIAYNIVGGSGLNINTVVMTIRGNAITITKELSPTLGKATTIWNGKDNNGAIVPPGDYYIEIEMQANGRTVISNTHKVVVTDCANVELISANAHTINTYVAVKDAVWLEGDAFGFNCTYQYNWDFKDGATSKDKNPLHFYQAEGMYFPTLTATCDKCSPPPLSSAEKVVVGCPAEALTDPNSCCALSPRKVIPNYPIQDLAQCPNRIANITTYVATFNGCGGAASIASQVPNNPMYNSHIADQLYLALHPYSDGDFTPACNGHDLCYGRCNAPKSSCDINIGLAMDAICYKDFSGAYLIECLGYSTLYESSVDGLGKPWYENAQKEACNCCKQ